VRIEQLRQRLQALGALPCHEQRVLQSWAQIRSLDTRHRRAENFLPLALRNGLPEIMEELAALARIRSEHPGEDGSARLLIGLGDGQTVESVLLPRDGLCVSTQVGCAVGCVFCMTGRDGLLRQLGSAEIVAQVVLARALRPVKKVVFMGMGEPAHNLENVIEAIELLGLEGGIGHKSLVFSTVGDYRAFEQLPRAKVVPALALSLHTTRADLREKLLPNAPRITPEELVELGERYARTTGYPIQYQWTLIDGINDTEEELDGIVRLLSGKYAIMNLIPYNTVDELEFKRPDVEKARAIARSLHSRRILTKLRNSAGQDIDGGCGQLRARESVKKPAPALSFSALPGTTLKHLPVKVDGCRPAIDGIGHRVAALFVIKTHGQFLVILARLKLGHASLGFESGVRHADIRLPLAFEHHHLIRRASHQSPARFIARRAPDFLLPTRQLATPFSTRHIDLGSFQEAVFQNTEHFHVKLFPGIQPNLTQRLGHLLAVRDILKRCIAAIPARRKNQFVAALHHLAKSQLGGRIDHWRLALGMGGSSGNNCQRGKKCNTRIHDEPSQIIYRQSLSIALSKKNLMQLKK
jgi:23S rRNA (adenine2503-C2)-methyltransferase